MKLATNSKLVVVDENDSHEALFAPTARGYKNHFQFPAFKSIKGLGPKYPKENLRG